MKVQINFKNPDAIYQIIEDRFKRHSEAMKEVFSDEYFEYGDYGRIEIDTETMACRILPRSEWK